MRYKRASRGFFVVPFWDRGAGPVNWEPRLEFRRSPLDGDVLPRLAVLALNLLHKPLTEVKSEAAKLLRGWLSE
jgi:hypothetical protein